MAIINIIYNFPPGAHGPHGALKNPAPGTPWRRPKTRHRVPTGPPKNPAPGARGLTRHDWNPEIFQKPGPGDPRHDVLYTLE